MSIRLIPPSRFLLVGLGAMSLLCFLVGFVLTRIAQFSLPVSPLKVKAQKPIEKVTLQLFFFTQEGAKQRQRELKKENYQTSFRVVQRGIKVQTGFIVADDLDVMVAKPVANTLKGVYGFPVTIKAITQKEIRVQVGSVYKTEAEANKILSKLKAVGFKWKIMPNYIEKPNHAYQVLILNLPSDKAKILKDRIAKQGIQVEEAPSHHESPHH